MHDEFLVMLESDDGFWKQKVIEDLHIRGYDLDLSGYSGTVGWKRTYESLRACETRFFVWG